MECGRQCLPSDPASPRMTLTTGHTSRTSTLQEQAPRATPPAQATPTAQMTTTPTAVSTPPTQMTATRMKMTAMRIITDTIVTMTTIIVVAIIIIPGLRVARREPQWRKMMMMIVKWMGCQKSWHTLVVVSAERITQMRTMIATPIALATPTITIQATPIAQATPITQAALTTQATPSSRITPMNIMDGNGPTDSELGWTCPRLATYTSRLFTLFAH